MVEVQRPQQKMSDLKTFPLFISIVKPSVLSFSQHKTTPHPPPLAGWDASLLPVPIYTPGWARHFKSKVSCSRTQHNDPDQGLNLVHSIWSPTPQAVYSTGTIEMQTHMCIYIYSIETNQQNIPSRFHIIIYFQGKKTTRQLKLTAGSNATIPMDHHTIFRYTHKGMYFVLERGTPVQLKVMGLRVKCNTLKILYMKKE